LVFAKLKEIELKKMELNSLKTIRNNLNNPFVNKSRNFYERGIFQLSKKWKNIIE
jgi:hypothetical protein